MTKRFVFFVLLSVFLVSCSPFQEGPGTYTFSNNKESKFEPSGLTSFANSRKDIFLLVNDKEVDSGFYEYTYNLSIKKLIPRANFYNPLLLLPEYDLPSLKWEGITNINPDIYLLSSYGDVFKTKFSNNSELKLEYCSKISKSLKRISSFIYTEGIALSRDGKSLLIGMRSREIKTNNVGEVYKVKLNETTPKPELVLSLEDLFDREGISSIEYDNYHKLYLVLTSIELDGNKRNSVSGYLWIVLSNLDSAEDGADKAIRVFKFDHKPEGVAVASCGDIVIIFDDDGRRKPSFGLKQNEASYKVIEEKIFAKKLRKIKGK